jgi:hypothetical protein
MKTLQDHIHSTERSGHIEFSVEERNEEYVISRMPVSKGILNPFGTVQAGAMIWLADVTASVLRIFFLQLSRKLTNLHGNSIPLPGEAIQLIFLLFSLPGKIYGGSPGFHCQFFLRNQGQKRYADLAPFKKYRNKPKLFFLLNLIG